jgi:ElaB/YqjD/DUF883 family membrane-anchored ribosome-binding protein
MSATDNQPNKSDETSHARRAAQAAHETVDRLAARGEAVEERLRDVKDDAEERARRRAAQARERSRQFADRVHDYVLEHPLTSLGAAFVAGFFLSTFNRRDR